MNLDVFNPRTPPAFAGAALAARRAHLVTEVAAQDGARLAPARFRRRRHALLLAAALLALLATGSAVGVRMDWFDSFAPPEIKRIGPRVQVASSGEWALTAWKSTRGVCLGVLQAEEAVSSGCGFPVVGAAPDLMYPQQPPQHLVGGMYGSRVGNRLYAAGVVAEHVDRAEVELRDGRLIPLEIVEAPPELDLAVDFFFVADVKIASGARGAVRAFNALDASGLRLDRLEFPGSPPERPPRPSK
jgi:hypothetical protein